MDIEQKAEEYADKTKLDKNTYRGDVVTAYVCGAMEIKRISNKVSKCPITAEEMLSIVKKR